MGLEGMREEEPLESDDEEPLSRKIWQWRMELAEMAKFAWRVFWGMARKVLSLNRTRARRRLSPMQHEEEAPAETEGVPEMLVEQPSEVAEPGPVLPACLQSRQN